MRLIEDSLAEKARFNQAELAALNEDATLLLNDETRINNSFINESQHKQFGGLQSGTPSKTPDRMLPRSRSATRHRRDDSVTNSQLMTSIDRPGEKTPATSVYGGNNDSVFLKSHDFPKMLKRQKQRNYTKVLIPFLVASEKETRDMEAEGIILDLYQIQRELKVEGAVEHFEGVCLIRNMRKPVVLKRSKEQKSVMQEIVTQLVFYENEISFKSSFISKMKDFFNTKGQFYVIYDKPGEVLSSLNISFGFLNDQQIKRMTENIALALNTIHSMGIVHAKVNSDSIFYKYESSTDTYTAIIGDFDRCFFENDPPAKVEADCCSAPEIVFGSALVDKRADFWSLGCIVFYIMTGKHLFPTTSRGGLAFLVATSLI